MGRLYPAESKEGYHPPHRHEKWTDTRDGREGIGTRGFSGLRTTRGLIPTTTSRGDERGIADAGRGWAIRRAGRTFGPHQSSWQQLGSREIYDAGRRGVPHWNLQRAQCHEHMGSNAWFSGILASTTGCPILSARGLYRRSDATAYRSKQQPRLFAATPFASGGRKTLRSRVRQSIWLMQGSETGRE